MSNPARFSAGLGVVLNIMKRGERADAAGW
jgi:hypothetical protein